MHETKCTEGYANRAGHDERFQAFIRGDNDLAARFLRDVAGSKSSGERYAEFENDSSGVVKILDAYIDTLEVAPKDHSDDGFLKTWALNFRSDLISDQALDQLAGIAEAHAQTMQDVAMAIIASYDEEDRVRIFGNSVEDQNFDDILPLSEDEVINSAHRLFTEAMVYGKDFMPFASEEAYDDVSNQYYFALATVSKMEAANEISEPGIKSGPLRSSFYPSMRKGAADKFISALPESMKALTDGLREPLKIENHGASHDDAVS